MTAAAAASGVLVVDKARGPTSHDVVARVRRTLGLRAVGHAGTLDPMATGVLVVAVGEATKLVPWLTAQDKTYEATIALGVETDTLDAEGEEQHRVPPGAALIAALLASCRGLVVAPLIEAALVAERARTSQVPPAFSAIKCAGERAYVRARRGEEVALATRDVRVERLELVACGDAPAFVSVVLDVGKGYYVRALARDLARALGTVGHLTSLRRVRSGSFVSSEAVAADASARDLLARLEPVARAAARALPVCSLTETGARDARHGRPVRPDDLGAPGPGPRAWLDARGDLVAIGEIDDTGAGRVLRGFSQAGGFSQTPAET
jgi:tRNA pseudouridine55 synthase